METLLYESEKMQIYVTQGLNNLNKHKKLDFSHTHCRNLYDCLIRIHIRQIISCIIHLSNGQNFHKTKRLSSLHPNSAWEEMSQHNSILQGDG
jgi:hypothetical protein